MNDVMSTGSGQRILILHGGAIGDLILAVPAIRALRERYPQATIELLGHPALGPLFDRRGIVDRMGTLDSLPLHHLFRDEADELTAGADANLRTAEPPDPVCEGITAEAPLTRREEDDVFSSRRRVLPPHFRGGIPQGLWDDLTRFDLIISWFGSGSEAYRRALARVPVRTLVARAIPPDDGPHHAVDYLIDTLAPLGVTTKERVPHLALTDSERQMGAHLLARCGAGDGPIVALHPGSGSPRKCWPAERFAELALALIERGLTILLIEGPADEAAVHEVLSRATQRINTGIRNRLLRVRQASLHEVAALLDRAILYIGNDSGITHLAAALGKPTLAIFTVTNPRIWGPRGNVVILEGSPSVEAVIAACEDRLLSVSARVLHAAPERRPHGVTIELAARSKRTTGDTIHGDLSPGGENFRRRQR
jgi:ADP-heptose:LPS heptosyltransferase